MTNLSHNRLSAVHGTHLLSADHAGKRRRNPPVTMKNGAELAILYHPLTANAAGNPGNIKSPQDGVRNHHRQSLSPINRSYDQLNHRDFCKITKIMTSDPHDQQMTNLQIPRKFASRKIALIPTPLTMMPARQTYLISSNTVSTRAGHLRADTTLLTETRGFPAPMTRLSTRHRSTPSRTERVCGGLGPQQETLPTTKSSRWR